jgi:hypothetical protein
VAGIRFNGQWYCSRDCVERAARTGLDHRSVPSTPAAALPPLRVGVLLRHMGVITEKQLVNALQIQQGGTDRIGVELRRMGAISNEMLLRALAAQSGVSYLASLDAARVTSGPAWMPASTVAALGLVPFESNEVSRTLRVVCPGPVPRASVRALIKLTGWAVEPYVVDDDLWPVLMRAYRPAASAAGQALSVSGVGAAAARVADAAATDRSIVMRHTSFGGQTWVRVEGPGQAADLMVLEEEEICQAARIAR